MLKQRNPLMTPINNGVEKSPILEKEIRERYNVFP